MTGGLNVEYLTMNIDVAWYGRRCSKFIRDKVGKRNFSFTYWKIDKFARRKG